MGETRANEIILIYPKTGLDTPETISMPLSLLLISARINQDRRFHITIIDQRVDKNWKRTLQKKLATSNILCVGLSTMTGTQIGFALKAAKLVRSQDTQIPIIWGGTHPTLTPKETIKDPCVDIVVVGEGEEIFPDLVLALYEQNNLELVQGIIFKNKEERIVSTGERKYADLNNLPEIPYHLVDINNYFYDIIGERALPMLFSRGCPHRCSFCYRSNSPPPKWRPLSLDKIIDEIKILYNLGARTIIPLDDNFFVDKDRILTICKLLHKENLSLKFHVNCRIDYADKMDEAYLKFLRDSGFVSWDFGVESGCQETLDFMHKDISINQIIRVNNRLRKLGILPTYSFMGGFINETFKDLKKTVNIMFKLVEDYPEAYLSQIKIYTPFPNTKMMEMLDNKYFAPPTSLRGWADYDYNTPHIIWHSKRKTRLLQQISYYSYFIDNKRIKMVFGKNSMLRFILNLYSQLAKLRLKKDLFFFPIDFFILKAIYKAKKLS